MNPVIISTKALSRSPRKPDQSASDALAQQTRFSDLPLQARLLLAVPRVRGRSKKAPIAERYVLDALGRIIDAGPARRQTIEAVNLLAEVLLTPGQFIDPKGEGNTQWLSAVENLVLCVLCKVRSGHSEEAARLTSHWLSKQSIESFNSAAVALCNSTCFKRGGPQVFTPGGSATIELTTREWRESVSKTNDLSLGELLLLNAIRLRVRTLPYTGIGGRVVPILRAHLAIPKIESLLDAHLVEALQYSPNPPDIRCLCSSVISVDEAQFLEAFAAFSTGDSELITDKLRSWLPVRSVDRLHGRTAEFKSIVLGIGTSIPLRQWDLNDLSDRGDRYENCEHINEPPMIH